LVPPGQEVKSTVDDAERAKYEKEFEEYYEQLEKAKKEYVLFVMMQNRGVRIYLPQEFTSGEK
jgi:N-dimethylarginine dimethylaminohydrolase